MNLNDVLRALRNADAAGDTAAATRLAQIADGLMKRPEDRIPIDYTLGETLTRGVSRGVKRLGSTFGDVLPAMVASGLGFDEYAKRQMEEAAQTEREIYEGNRPQFESYKQVTGPMGALKYGIETVAEQVPNIATSLVPGLGAAGLATRAGLGVAGRAAAVGAGSFLGSYAQNAPEVFQNIYQETGKLEPGAAALFGVASAALDSILPASLARNLSGPVKAGIVEKILEKSGMDRGLLRSVTAGVVKGVPTEGLTEGAQEAISIAAERFIAENPQVFGSKEWDRIMESAVRGAVAGGAFGGAGGAGEAARAGAERRELYAQALERRGQRQLAAQVRNESIAIEDIDALKDQLELPGFELGPATGLVPPKVEEPKAPKELKGKQAELFTPEGELTPALTKQATRDEKAQANRDRQEAQRRAAEVKEAQAKLKKYLAAKQQTLPGFDEESIKAYQAQAAAQQQAAQETGQGDLFAPPPAAPAAATPAAPVSVAQPVVSQPPGQPSPQPETTLVEEPKVRSAPPISEITKIEDPKAFGKLLGIGPTARILRPDGPLAGKDLTNPADAAEVKSVLEAYASGKPAAGAAAKIEEYLKRPEFQGATDVARPVEPTVGAGVGVSSEPAAGPAAGAVEGTQPSGMVSPTEVVGEPDVREGQQPAALTEEVVAPQEAAPVAEAPKEPGKRAKKDRAKAEAGAEQAAKEQAQFVQEVDQNTNDILTSRLREVTRAMGLDDNEVPAEDYRGTDAHNQLRLAQLMAQYRDSESMLRESVGTPQEAKNQLQLVDIEKEIAASGPDALEFFQQLRQLPVTQQVGVISHLNRQALTDFSNAVQTRYAAQAKERETLRAEYQPVRRLEGRELAQAKAQLARNRIIKAAQTVLNAIKSPAAKRKFAEDFAKRGLEAVNDAIARMPAALGNTVRDQVAFLYGDLMDVAPSDPKAKRDNQGATDATIKREVSNLPEKDQEALELEYDAPRDSDRFLSRLKEDIATVITEGIDAIAKSIRKAVQKVAEGVLAVALIFNPNATLPNFSFDLPKAYSQTVNQTVELREQVPAEAVAKMSLLAREVYESMAPTAKRSGKGFIIADKPNGVIHFFKPDGTVLVQDGALFGKDTGDVLGKDSLLGGPKVTPAGKFGLSVVSDAEYAGGKILQLNETVTKVGPGQTTVVAIHPAYLGNAKEKRAEKLEKLRAGEAAESKVSYGCINTAHDTFLKTVLPNINMFNGGMLFVLPDAQETTKSMFPAETRTETKTVTGFEKTAKAPTSLREQLGVLKQEKRSIRQGRAPDWRDSNEPQTTPPKLEEREDGRVLDLVVDGSVVESFELVSPGLWNAFKSEDARQNLLRNQDARTVAEQAYDALQFAKFRFKERGPLNRAEKLALEAIDTKNVDELELLARNEEIRGSIMRLLSRAIHMPDTPLIEGDFVDVDPVAAANLRKYAPDWMLGKGGPKPITQVATSETRRPAARPPGPRKPLFLPAYQGPAFNQADAQLAQAGDLKGLMRSMLGQIKDPAITKILRKIQSLNLKTKLVVGNPEGPMALPVFYTDQLLGKENVPGQPQYGRELRNPVTLKDGTRLDGFSDAAQTTFTGYDSNGNRITMRRSAVSVSDIQYSRDSNRTAQALQKALEKMYAESKAGSYDPATDTITLDPNSGLNAHTFIHELVHAAISNVLAKPDHPLTKDFQKFFVTIQDRLGAAYGAQDLQEFAAELVGNPSFQAVLKAMKTPRSESMFRHVLRKIAEFLGFAPKSNAFNTGLDFIEKALDITNGVEPTAAQKMFLINGDFPAVAAIGQAMPALTRQTAEAAKNMISNLGEGGGLKAMGLGLLRLDNLRNMYGKELPGIQKLLDALELRTGMQERAIKHVNDNYKKFMKVQRKHGPAMKRLNDIAIDARLEEVDILDPNFQPTAAQRPAYDRLKSQFDALPKDVQDVYRTIRKDYDDSFYKYRKILMDAAEQASPSLAKRLAEQFQTQKPVAGYIPFLRQGNFWVEYNDPATGNVAVSAFQSFRERQQFVDQMLKGQNYRTYQNVEDAPFAGDRLPPTHFIMQVMNQLRAQKASQAQLDGVYQAYLATFPADSLMKQFMKSKNVAGMERDIVRGYGDLMVRYARKLANSEYIPQIDRALREIQDQATNDFQVSFKKNGVEQTRAFSSAQARDEFIKRELPGVSYNVTNTNNSSNPDLSAVATNINQQSAFFHNPNFGTLVHTATALSYFEFIAGNISSALINITSLPMLVYPLLTGKYGWGNTTAAMTAASKTAMGDWSKGKYKNLYDTLMDHAQLEHTMSREVLEGRRQSTNDYLGIKARIMDGLSIPFAATERYNRGVTAIAAYDLAKQSGMNEQEAVRYALNTVKDVHTSGMAATGPKWMQTPLGRLFFTFKSFVWNSAYVMARAFHQAFKGEDKVVRDAARRQLLATYGMATVFTGIKGMPFYGAVSVLANMLNALFGDDDEPFDFDEFLRDIFGEFLFKGAFNYATNLELANRAGIATDLIFRDDPRGVAEHGYVLSAMQQAFGPAGAIAVNSGRAINLFNEGEVVRGIEAVAPSFVRNISKGFRYLNEGATTLKGDPIMEDIGVYNSVMQMIGFSPADLSSRYETLQAAKGFEREIRTRRSNILKLYDMGVTSGDYDLVARAQEEAQAFNERHPGIPITPDSFRRSIKARQAAEKDMIYGVRFDKKLRPEIEAKFFEDED